MGPSHFIEGTVRVHVYVILKPDHAVQEENVSYKNGVAVTQVDHVSMGLIFPLRAHLLIPKWDKLGTLQLQKKAAIALGLSWVPFVPVICDLKEKLQIVPHYAKH